MLFNLKLHNDTLINFLCIFLDPFSCAEKKLFFLQEFRYLVRFYRLENLQEPKLFNYFYLSRYFLGKSAKVFFLKKYFILGRHYYNMELGFILRAPSLYGPLSLWIFQTQPMVNLALTRDFILDSKQLELILLDSSIFNEKKTNTGLFDLSDPLRFFLSYRRQITASQKFHYKIFCCFKLILN